MRWPWVVLAMDLQWLGSIFSCLHVGWPWAGQYQTMGKADYVLALCRT